VASLCAIIKLEIEVLNLKYLNSTMEKIASIPNTAEKSFAKEVSWIMSKDFLRKDRDKRVLMQRYGLDGMKPRTLEAIGKDLKITRERVRQIEKIALSKMGKAVENEERIQGFHKKLEDKVESMGGLVNQERIVAAFIPTKEQTPKEINSFLFLITLDKNVQIYKENNELRTHVTLLNTDRKKLMSISCDIDQLFAKIKKVLKAEELSEKLDVDIKVIESLLYAKKNVLQTEDKKWGLITWREVNPKSIRDKTYLILKKHKNPLHYTEIAQKISEHKMQKKPVTKQAVHNELIRDKRFVLIGRGIYALSDWGYKHGVVEDVIRDILKEHGRPMHKSEIIDHVKKHRIVKETTIILNLQKNSFRRVARATYSLADDKQ